MSDPQIVQDVTHARNAGTPLIGIQTTDPAATIAILSPTLKDEHGKPATLLAWDVVRGPRALTKESEKAIDRMVAAAGGPSAKAGLADFVFLLDVAGMPGVLTSDTILFVHNAHLFIEKSAEKQAIWNLRDAFKLDGRMLVLMGPSIMLPPELDGDVITFDEPLPTTDEIRVIIDRQIKNAQQTDAKVPTPTAEQMTRAAESVTGLTGFSVEQVTAMNIRRSGLHIPGMRERRCGIINQTPGTSVWRGDESFDGIGGNENIKRFLTKLRGGFNAVWWIDEIEKQFSGSTSGESSGTAADQHMLFLTYMQDKRVPAVLLVGHPGTGKSEIAKAFGNECDTLTLRFDLGAMLHGIVGSSQARARQALKVGDAVSNGKPFIIATSNDLEALSPELRSRFRLGTFMFDLPDDDEQAVIWKLHIKLNGIKTAVLPECTGWTGREISSCCDLARRMSCSLVEAAKYIVPVSKSQAARVQKLRERAAGNFISAAYEGVFQLDRAPKMPVARERRISAAV